MVTTVGESTRQLVAERIKTGSELETAPAPLTRHTAATARQGLEPLELGAALAFVAAFRKTGSRAVIFAASYGTFAGR